MEKDKLIHKLELLKMEIEWDPTIVFHGVIEEALRELRQDPYLPVDEVRKMLEGGNE